MGNDIATLELTNKVVILKAEAYRGDILHRTFLCEDGFGTSPTALGTAIYGKTIYDGEKFRISRRGIERLATAEETANAEAYIKEHPRPPELEELLKNEPVGTKMIRGRKISFSVIEESEIKLDAGRHAINMSINTNFIFNEIEQIIEAKGKEAKKILEFYKVENKIEAVKKALVWGHPQIVNYLFCKMLGDEENAYRSVKYLRIYSDERFTEVDKDNAKNHEIKESE